MTTVSVNNIEQGLESRRPSVVDNVTPRKASVGHVVAAENLSDKNIVKDAANAEAREREMTIWQGLKTYPKAIGWSILFSTAIIMEGYDLVFHNPWLLRELELTVD